MLSYSIGGLEKMKEISKNDIEIVKSELQEKRKEFESLKLPSLNEKLEWIQNFFNIYVPELEERYLSKEEREQGVFLPDELRIYYYLYFPEHGLNMAKSADSLFLELEGRKRFNTNKRISFRHQD